MTNFNKQAAGTIDLISRLDDALSGSDLSVTDQAAILESTESIIRLWEEEALAYNLINEDGEPTITNEENLALFNEGTEHLVNALQEEAHELDAHLAEILETIKLEGIEAEQPAIAINMHALSF
jgi:hypothetical protein